MYRIATSQKLPKGCSLVSVSEPSYHTTKVYSENLLAIETKRTQISINKTVYLGLSILKIGKIVMY